MDCKKAEDLMLQYIEKIIKPSDAKALALHLLKCESCSEYFSAFDAAIEDLDTDAVEFTDAPEGFTEAVMSKVKELPVYHEKAKVIKDYNSFIRITSGLGVIIAGLVLFLVPGLTSAEFSSGALAGISQWYNSSVVPLFNSAIFSAPNLSITALIFAAVISVLLVTLLRGESESRSDNARA